MKRLLFVLILLLPVLAQADSIRMKCGTVSADSANDWYYTKGLNGAAHNPSADNSFYYVGYTGSFERRSTVTFYGVQIPKDATIDSAYMKSLWVSTDSTIKPTVYIYAWSAEASDTICDSIRFATAYTNKTTALDSMYDSLWARNTTAFTWARTWRLTSVMQELVNTSWWQQGDTAVFIRLPKSGTTGDRYFNSLNYNGGGDSLIVFFTSTAPPIGGGGTGPRVMIRK